MSRSYRKNSITGITKAASEKQDKCSANRKERRVVKQSIAADPTSEVFPQKREISEVWRMDKDGKHWFDAKKHPKLMRN